VRSKSKKTRSSPSAPAGPAPAGGAPAPASRHGNGRGAPPPEGFDPSVDGDQDASAESPPAKPASRRALKNWRVRSRLVLLIAIPTLTAIVLGGIRIGSSAQSAVADQRVEKLAQLSEQVTGLAEALQNERNDIIQFIVLGSGPDPAAIAASSGRGGSPAGGGYKLELGVLNRDYAKTDALAAQVRSGTEGIGGSYPFLAQQEAQDAVTAISGIKAVRAAATGSKLPALTVINKYSGTIDQILALDDEIGGASNDSTLSDSVRVLGLVSRMKEEASEQQAILTSAQSSDLIGQGDFGADKLAAIQAAQVEQQSNLDEFQIAASTEQRQLFQSELSGTNATTAQQDEAAAIGLAQSSSVGRSTNSTDPTISNAATAME
jgi:hypothetical protein